MTDNKKEKRLQAIEEATKDTIERLTNTMEDLTEVGSVLIMSLVLFSVAYKVRKEKILQCINMTYNAFEADKK